ncbi:hypothetical protein EF912_26400 [Streptomyces sp. WAC07061]|uniref:hypothetical protein n=1 Tax=Streptomyces sp. WAC07061 TaxID=2487410 RepID=UPI000F778C75|nr:hypothetical protein [Streptomyces sp. WAC07061]RSS47616.1 hypothetical protein EF912_26400 [Streptomyces sp. WAC07061]
MKKKRTLGVLAATFTAAVLPMVAATPASATSFDCQIYLSNVGYTVGPRVKDACAAGADRSVLGSATAWPRCISALGSLGIKQRDVVTACTEAGN